MTSKREEREREKEREIKWVKLSDREGDKGGKRNDRILSWTKMKGLCEIVLLKSEMAKERIISTLFRIKGAKCRIINYGWKGMS